MIVVEMLDEILGGMDKELLVMFWVEYVKKGIKFLFSMKVVGVFKGEIGIIVLYENVDGIGIVIVDKLLMSVGCCLVIKGFGLENLNLEWMECRCIKVDEYL